MRAQAKAGRYRYARLIDTLSCNSECDDKIKISNLQQQQQLIY